MVVRGNDPGAPSPAVVDLLAWCGESVSVSQRAESLLLAHGVAAHERWGWMEPGTADHLTSSERAGLIGVRDRWMEDGWVTGPGRVQPGRGSA